MPKQPISGFRSHPEHEEMSLYALDSPEGVWIGRLDFVAWGKQHNLICYFTEEATGRKYCLSTFWSKQFKPYTDGPSFREELPGARYEIQTTRSRNGLPRFDLARRLEEAAKSA
jgi:hypothetical protein